MSASGNRAGRFNEQGLGLRLRTKMKTKKKIESKVKPPIRLVDKRIERLRKMAEKDMIKIADLRDQLADQKQRNLLLSDERDRRWRIERALEDEQILNRQYRERMLESKEVWNRVLVMFGKMGIDCGPIVSSKFFIDGVLLTRPEQVDSDNSDLRRELRKLLVGKVQPFPNTVKIITACRSMFKYLSPQAAANMAKTAEGEIGLMLKSYSLEANVVAEELSKLGNSI